MFPDKLVRSILVAVRATALLTWLLLGTSGYPPARAQTRTDIWRSNADESATDRVQDQRIEELNEHLAHSDGIMDGADRRVRDIEMTMSEARGEARAAYLFLGLLTSGSIVLQVRMRGKIRAEKGDA